MCLSQGPIHLSGLRWYTSSRKPSGAPKIYTNITLYLPCHRCVTSLRLPHHSPTPAMSQTALHLPCHSPTPTLQEPCPQPATALYLPCSRPIPAQPHTALHLLYHPPYHTYFNGLCTSPLLVSWKDAWKPRLHLFFSPLDSLKMVGLGTVIKLL